MAAFFISIVCGMPGGATLTRPTKATTARTVGRVRRSRHPANKGNNRTNRRPGKAQPPPGKQHAQKREPFGSLRRCMLYQN
ncbi:hypothetical protein C3387_20310 [Leclercia sp. LSNIH6]|nr:hypothetical protein C3387_20310 [Leclercia sp. LSNIH6]POU74223.1 hypothetical protein C3370_11265 [Leclercia sp. LSNIH7]POW54460.1 hypothetical protein C3406_04355 [Leclercia sp. LSNIH8]